MIIACSGILFDNDGVLVDSDTSVHRAWSAWAMARGLDPDEIMPMVHGRKSRETVAILIAEDERDEALADVDARELEDAERVTALPGSRALLESLPRSRWAIVTSATRPLGTARLAGAGLPLPDCLITADDVAHGKPDPEGYAAAARHLGLSADQVIVIEDSPAGIRAGRAAGVAAVIGVGERALAADPDVVINDLRDLEWVGDGVKVLRTLNASG